MADHSNSSRGEAAWVKAARERQERREAGGSDGENDVSIRPGDFNAAGSTHGGSLHGSVQGGSVKGGSSHGGSQHGSVRGGGSVHGSSGSGVQRMKSSTSSRHTTQTAAAAVAGISVENVSTFRHSHVLSAVMGTVGKVQRSTIHPTNPWFRRWFIFTALLSFLNGWQAPFLMAFKPPNTGSGYYVTGWGLLDLFTMSLFAVDMVVKFFVGTPDIENGGAIAMNHKRIAQLYMKSIYFWMDLISTIPFDWIIVDGIFGHVGITDPTTISAARMLNLLMLLRMYRVFELFALLDYKMVFSQLVMVLLRNGMYCFLTVHWAACLYFKVALLQRGLDGYNWVARVHGQSPTYFTDADGMFGKYLRCMSCMFGTFVALSDAVMYAWSVWDCLFLICFLVLCVFVFAFVMGTVSMLVVKSDKKKKKHYERVEALRTFSDACDLPDVLYKAMYDHLELVYHTDQASDEHTISKFPTAISRKALRHLYLQTLEKCYLFEGCKLRFFDQVLAKAKIEVLMPETHLLMEGDLVPDLCIVVGGSVGLTRNIIAGVANRDETGTAAILGAGPSHSGPTGGGDNVSQHGVKASGASKAGQKGSVVIPEGAASPKKGIGFAGSKQKKGHPDEEAAEEDEESPNNSMHNGAAMLSASAKGEGSGGGGPPHGGLAMMKKLGVLGSTSGKASSGGGLARSASNSLLKPSASSLARNSSNGRGSGGSNKRRASMVTTLGGGKSFKVPSKQTMKRMNSQTAKGCQSFGGASSNSMASALVREVGTRGPSTVFGELAWITDTNAPETAMTTTVTRIMQISKDDWDELVRLFPRQARVVLYNMMAKAKSTLVADLKGAMLMGQLTEEEFKFIKKTVNAGAKKGLSDVDPKQLIKVKGMLTPGQTELLMQLDDLRKVVSLKTKEIDTMRTYEMLNCAAAGDYDMLEGILSGKYSPDSADMDGRTALMLASNRGKADCVRLLLHHGASTDKTDNFGNDAMSEAVNAGHMDVIDILVLQGGKLNKSGADLAVLLCTCVYENDLPRLMRWIKAGADVNAADYDARVALQIAAGEGNLKATKLLVEAGADVTAKDRFGYTALDEAMRVGAELVVEYLLPLYSPDRVGQATAQFKRLRGQRFLRACMDGILQQVAWMYDKQNPTNVVSGLMVAALRQHTPVVEWLLHHLGRLTLEHTIGAAATIESSWEGHEGVLSVLEGRGARLDNILFPDVTDLIIQAVKGEEVAFVARAVKAGVQPDAPTRDGERLLHAAAATGNIDMVRVLVELGSADISQLDGTGMTAHEVAAAARHRDVCEYLSWVKDHRSEAGDADAGGAAGPAQVVPGRSALGNAAVARFGMLQLRQLEARSSMKLHSLKIRHRASSDEDEDEDDDPYGFQKGSAAQQAAAAAEAAKPAQGGGEGSGIKVQERAGHALLGSDYLDSVVLPEDDEEVGKQQKQQAAAGVLGSGKAGAGAGEPLTKGPRSVVWPSMSPEDAAPGTAPAAAAAAAVASAAGQQDALLSTPPLSPRLPHTASKLPAPNPDQAPAGQQEAEPAPASPLPPHRLQHAPRPPSAARQPGSSGTDPATRPLVALSSSPRAAATVTPTPAAATAAAGGGSDIIVEAETELAASAPLGRALADADDPLMSDMRSELSMLHDLTQRHDSRLKQMSFTTTPGSQTNLLQPPPSGTSRFQSSTRATAPADLLNVTVVPDAAAAGAGGQPLAAEPGTAPQGQGGIHPPQSPAPGAGGNPRRAKTSLGFNGGRAPGAALSGPPGPGQDELVPVHLGGRPLGMLGSGLPAPAPAFGNIEDLDTIERELSMPAGSTAAPLAAAEGNAPSSPAHVSSPAGGVAAHQLAGGTASFTARQGRPMAARRQPSRTDSAAFISADLDRTGSFVNNPQLDMEIAEVMGQQGLQG